MLDCTVNVKYCEIYYECLNGNIFKECDCTNIRVVNCISAKQRFLVKSSFQFFWAREVKTGSLNSVYKRDRENKDHKNNVNYWPFISL